jgi:hypothetical protein
MQAELVEQTAPASAGVFLCHPDATEYGLRGSALLRAVPQSIWRG